MTYYFDIKRHLVCMPYSISNLHKMADDLGINHCWFHGGKYPHYDIPLYLMKEIEKYAVRISSKEILKIIKNND